jgi:cell envelope opacity-associated protein A
MLKSLLLGLFATVAVAVYAQATWAAEDKTHEGFVVSVAEGKLTMADKDGKNEHTHDIPATARITLDGKAAKLADLKKGDSVKVTAGADGKVSAIAATRAKTPA